MNTIDLPMHDQADTTEFRMSVNSERLEMLLLASLFAVTVCFVMYFLALPWGWHLLPVAQVLLYGVRLYKASVMEVYTQPFLRYPQVVMKWVGGQYVADEGFSIIDQSLRLNHLLSGLKGKLGADHPVFLEVHQYGPYSVRERINHMFEPDTRRDVRNTIQKMCDIINHTPSL